MPWLDRAEEKRQVTRRILESLPDWFGIPEAVDEYVREAGDLPCFVCMREEQAVGFVCVKQTSACAAEVHVMGVLPGYHRQGIGRVLIAACEAYCRTRRLPLLHVKTLSDTAEDPFYLKTLAFYRAQGFLPLEVLPLWDERNPCLLLVKPLA